MNVLKAALLLKRAGTLSVRARVCARPAVFAPVRTLASSTDNDLSKVQEVMHKVNDNPQIRALLDEFQVLLQEKGFDPSKQPSFTEIMRLFADSKVRGLILQLKEEFDKAGIKVLQEDMGAFMKFFK